MFATIIMNNQKGLQSTTTPIIYQQENNADKILVLLPKFYGDIDLKTCSVSLNWIQPINQTASVKETGTDTFSGNIKLLEFEENLYKDTYLQAVVPITVTETSVVGKLELFLTIVNSDKNINMKTGSTFIDIIPHKSITNFVEKAQIELLSDYLIKMQQLTNTCNQVLQQATEQANKTTETANLIIQMMQKWEDEHKK
jgi:hypothetical protein